MSTLRPLSESVTRITTQTFTKKHVSLARILTHWTDIMGPDMATKAAPVKLRYKGAVGNREKNKTPPKATLEIAVTSADAAGLYYKTDLILERIQNVFGQKWIEAIRFVHLPANAGDPPPLRKPRKKADLLQMKQIDQNLDDIADDELKQRLSRLGAAIHADDA